MGKKLKVGKARKDKYYRLAKDTGYRSRASFKLLQLNQKFQFLQKSSTCVDLCAAPGGWSQVAQQYMPVSSLIIAIDLVSIKPLHGITTIKADITSEKCKQILNNLLPEKKADLILHDGAPNVGKNWIHDAFKQAELTLHAFKLATCFLSRGGFFITKMFRSKDYFSILWVFQQLFKKVHATKPQASRNESAEIFVVCQGYLAPDKIDPKFLDIRHVFKDVAQETSTTFNLAHPERQKKKAEGYVGNSLVVRKPLSALEFATSENYLILFKNCTEIIIDDERILNHVKTTDEIKECLKDVQVLGKKDLKNILTWQKAIRKFINSQKTKEIKEKGINGEVESGEKDEDDPETMILAEEEAEIDEKEKEISSIVKKKKKKVLKEKKKLRDKMALKMILPNDFIDVGGEIELFNLKTIHSEKNLEKFEEHDEMQNDIFIEKEDQSIDNKKKCISFSRHRDIENENNSNKEDNDDEIDNDEDDKDGNDLEMEELTLSKKYDVKNPLLDDLQSPKQGKKNITDLWFSKGSFADCKLESDDDLDVNDFDDVYDMKRSKKRKIDYESEKKIGTIVFSDDEKEDSEDDDKNPNSEEDNKFISDDDFSDPELTNDNINSNGIKKLDNSVKKTLNREENYTNESVVPLEKKTIKLTPLELAIGEEIVSSKKRKREIIEMTYNRFSHMDDNVPDWFLQDEMKHSKKQLPVSKEQIQYYKDKQKAIDANPIKKIAEARARKKNRLVKRLEKARKKSENLVEDMSEKEKLKRTKEIYKKAGLLKAQKKNVTYVVAKKGVGKRVARPAGVKGHYKVVDPRMKKEKRKNNSKSKNGKKGSKNMNTRKGKSKGKMPKRGSKKF